MNGKLLIVAADRALGDWMCSQARSLWPDYPVQLLDPSQLQAQDLANVALRRPQTAALVLVCQCAAGSTQAADGLETLSAVLGHADSAPAVVIALSGDELSAVQAMRLGARDYQPRAGLSAQSFADAVGRILASTFAVTAGARASPAHTPVANAPATGVKPRLPQYTILHKLGESNRSQVYLAFSERHGREVALKLRPAQMEPGDDNQEFAREYAAIRAINHSAVVKIYDYGFHQGREFICMEYFPCGDLKLRLRQPVTTLEALQYSVRISAALEVVHASGIVHRDLKPPNVMLRDNGDIVLIDFGIAKGVAAHEHQTAVGVLRGSPYYMSPEQVQGLTLDARSDIYSLGVILFEMLTGTKPYVGGSAIDVMQQHIRGPRPPLPSGCDDIDPVMDRLMAADRDHRFQNAREVTLAFAALIEGRLAVRRRRSTVA